MMDRRTGFGKRLVRWTLVLTVVAFGMSVGQWLTVREGHGADAWARAMSQLGHARTASILHAVRSVAMTPVVNGFVNSAINVPRDRLLHAFGFMMGEDSRFFFARSHDLFTDDWRGILMFALGTVVVYFPVAVFAALLKFDDEDLRADLDLPPRLRRALILLLVVAGAGVYAFRWQEYDDDYWGRVRLVWRWGRAAEIRMDRNRDGIVDLRLRYDRPSTVFYHNPPDEYWEDRDFNGRDDMHVRYAGMIVDVVRLDEDEDGVFERVLRGGAAIAYRAANAPFSPIHPQRRAR